MSRTRNQRRRDNKFEKIFCLFMLAFLLLLTVAIMRQCQDINELQERLNERGAIVVRAENYLPANFDRSAYEAACRRYEVEQGHIIPEQKEAAPESANSEAVDTDKSAS